MRPSFQKGNYFKKEDRLSPTGGMERVPFRERLHEGRR